eukprot:4107123-Pyramimonas_sp.AAC.1
MFVHKHVVYMGRAVCAGRVVHIGRSLYTRLAVCANRFCYVQAPGAQACGSGARRTARVRRQACGVRLRGAICAAHAASLVE